ncbi:DUF6913 domain-containing protein [Flavobacterium reichenbachii]|uniref:Uncharacterized protein n=1 Tax=Flavobacterium reichenbachii TaxID=362418 RepID=A0A085ZJ31_9FLAO|nr:hypothetical protein [Flavobacterium reichenbachii]KFF04445.1 hypothetical protein IW19_02385 [Flavobacterium reichenbachii]OXB12590.1 hypothetical protein B0A68_17515 [Flavobacterium reichenbachii]
MFLNYIKEFFVKKTLKKYLRNVKSEVFTSNIKTIGLLVDESEFHDSEALIDELILNGITQNNIEIVAYKDKFKKKDTYSRPTFGKTHISWSGKVEEDFLNEFIKTEFDLLISYYNVENPFMMLVTQQSKAKFKVGFAAVEENLNRWMINTEMRNYKIFISELFKYLKSLK